VPFVQGLRCDLSIVGSAYGGDRVVLVATYNQLAIHLIESVVERLAIAFGGLSKGAAIDIPPCGNVGKPSDHGIRTISGSLDGKNYIQIVADDGQSMS
jgi:hypothetical protein